MLEAFSLKFRCDKKADYYHIYSKLYWQSLPVQWNKGKGIRGIYIRNEEMGSLGGSVRW